MVSQEKPPQPQPRILGPDRGLAGGGLPGDLRNVAASLLAEFSNFERGTTSETELREAFAQARTFDEYYKGQVEKWNQGVQEGGQPLYDAEATVQAQRAAIPDQSKIEAFDSLMLQLRVLDPVKEIEGAKRIIEESLMLIQGPAKS